MPQRRDTMQMNQGSKMSREFSQDPARRVGPRYKKTPYKVLVVVCC